MWRAYVRGVMAGSLVAILFSAALMWLVASTQSWDPETVQEVLWVLGIVALTWVILIALLALFPGRLFLAGLRRVGVGGAAGYVGAGLATGATVFAGFSALIGAWDATGVTLVTLAAMIGAAVGYAWSLTQRPRRLREIAADADAPRRPIWTPPEPLKLRPLAFVMGLVVIGFAVAVGAAGEGRFDRLPPQQYFAPGLWTKGPLACQAPMNDFESEWYSTHLRAAQEPSLYLASQAPATRSARTYRFTWLRSFHAPVTVRVDETPGGVLRLTARLLSGAGGYEPGGIAARVDRDLTAEEAQRFERLVARSRLFRATPWDCQGGVDGAQWLLEANERGAYLFLKRWSPERGEVRDIGLLLIGFTGWRFDPIY